MSYNGLRVVANSTDSFPVVQQNSIVIQARVDNGNRWISRPPYQALNSGIRVYKQSQEQSSQIGKSAVHLLALCLFEAWAEWSPDLQ